jgi:RNA polymerase sigma factor (sigma-70 family)
MTRRLLTHIRERRNVPGVRRDVTRLSDAELLQAGEPDAFVELYDRYLPRLLTWACRRVGEHAADLTAEVFARAWLQRKRFHDRADGSAAPWLFGIAANVLRDSLRRQRVETAARRKLGLPEAVAPDEEFEAVENRLSLPEAALQAARGLPADERELLQLRVVEERPYREIAARLGCSEQAARLRVSRALRRLHATLEGEGAP